MAQASKVLEEGTYTLFNKQAGEEIGSGNVALRAVADSAGIVKKDSLIVGDPEDDGAQDQLWVIKKSSQTPGDYTIATKINKKYYARPQDTQNGSQVTLNETEQSWKITEDSNEYTITLGSNAELALRIRGDQKEAKADIGKRDAGYEVWYLRQVSKDT